MALTSQQKIIAGKIKIAMDAVEEIHGPSESIGTLHYWLGKGLDTFEADFTPEEFIDLGGGGTNKVLP